MSTTLEQLEIEVQSSAATAAKGINALASSLGKLKTATTGINGGAIGQLTQSLKSLSSLGGLKISSSIATQITNIGAAVKSLNGTDFSALGSLAIQNET